MLGLIKAKIQGMFRADRSDGADLRGSAFRSLFVEQAEPQWYELARAGRLFVGGITVAANGIAPVQDVPTTTAAVLLYNNTNPQRGQLLVPLRVGVTNSGGTAAVGMSLIAGVTPGPLPTLTTANSTGCTVGRTNGGTAGNAAYVATAATVPTMAAQYTIVGGQESTADATVGAGFAADLHGAFVVPGQYGLALGILSGAGTSPKFMVSVLFALLDGDLD